MAIVGVNISIAYPQLFAAAMAEAEALGLKVEAAFPDQGTASGLIDEAELDMLRQVPGLVVEGDAVVAILAKEHAHGHPVEEPAEE